MSSPNKSFIYSCSHCSCTIFVLILCSVHLRHANFDFNCCSVFTDSCFVLWKRSPWSKSLLRFPPPGNKTSSTKFPILLPLGGFPPLTLFGKTLGCSVKVVHWHVLSFVTCIYIQDDIPCKEFFFNRDSLHARLNSHYEARSYKKGSTKKITGNRKSV